MLTDTLKPISDGLRAGCYLALDNPEVFKRNLLYLYSTMVASEPLLIDAYERTPAQPGFLTKYKAYLGHHIEEEHNHDKWMLDDLLYLDLLPGDNWLAAALSGSMYYAVRHMHPVALLGYMYFMEGAPMPLEHVEQLETVHGVKAMRTVRYHSIHDVDHSVDLRAIINEVPKEYHQTIIGALRQTGMFYALACQSMRE